MKKKRKNIVIAIIMFTMLLITSTVFAEEWKSISNVNDEESGVKFDNEGNGYILTTDNKVVKFEGNKIYILENSENCSLIIDKETGFLTEIKTKEGSVFIGNNEEKEKSEQEQKDEALLFGITIIIIMCFMYAIKALLNETSQR